MPATTRSTRRIRAGCPGRKLCQIHAGPKAPIVHHVAAPATQNPGGTGWLRWVAIGITVVATLPLDETGVGEGLDTTVIATETATDVAGQATADVAAGATEDEGANSVVIGENMEERVQPAADRIGADTYQPDSTAPRSEWEQNQRDWINKQMDDGKTIYDCGPDPERPSYPGISSPWYQIERNEIVARSYPTSPLDC